MTATIDGSPWTAIGLTTGLATGPTRLISGSDLTRSLVIGFAPSTGNQATGSTSVVFCRLIIGSQIWQAGLTYGGNGTVSVTTLTSTRAVGTFSFTAPGATAGTTPATRTLASGTFDVRF
jgi:hypothetical protein